MKSNRSVTLVLALLVVLLAIGFMLIRKQGAPSADTGEEIKIGAILPLSGEVSNWGQDSSNGIDLALEEANNRPKGKKYRIIYENSKGNAADAVAAARKLTSVDRVSAIIGDNISGPTVAFVPIADAAKTPVISVSASSPKLSGMSKYFFRVYPSDSAEGAFMAEVAFNRLNLKKVGILYVNNEFGVGLRDVFTSQFQELGGKIVKAVPYNEDETDFRPYLTSMAPTEPEALYLAGYFRDGGAIMRQARELGIKAKFLGSTTHEDPELIQIARDSANGLVYPYSTGYDPKSTDPVAIQFRDAFRRKYNKDPGLVAALAYDCARLVIQAVEKDGADREKIRNYLDAIEKYEGATGSMTFDQNGDVQKTVRLKEVKDGAFSFID